MSTLDSLNIDPGYAIIYHIVVDYKYLFVKSQLEANGFTVISHLPPCEELNGTAFIRRINIPNLWGNAYAYIRWKDYGIANRIIQDFCDATLDVADFQKGHLYFTSDPAPAKPRGKVVKTPCKCAKIFGENINSDDELDAEDNTEIACTDNTIAIQEIADIVGDTIRYHALKKHAFPPVDQLFQEIYMNQRQ